MFRRFFRKKSTAMERMKKMKMKRIENVEIAEYKMDFTYEFFGKDGEKYVVLWEKVKNDIDIKIWDVEGNTKPLGVALQACVKDDYYFLASIDAKNFLKRGFGTALMLTFFEIIVAKTNINQIEGDFSPHIKVEHVMNFYKSFHLYEDTEKIIRFEFDEEMIRIKYSILRKNAP